jgi:transposase-like protein
MTHETMNLQELLEKTTDADFLRDMIGYTAQRLMDVEVEALTGAAPGVRSPGRTNQRNGYRDRTWETRTGTVELRTLHWLSTCFAGGTLASSAPNCAKGATSRAFSNPGGWPRRR